MCAIMDFKSKGHVLFHHFELMDLFQLLIIFALSQWERPVDTLEERVFHFNSVAVLRVREENSHVLVRGAEGVRLHQVRVRAVGLHYRARDLTLLAREH